MQALKDLIAFCESKQLGDVANGLKKLDASKSSQKDALRVIADAIVAKERG